MSANETDIDAEKKKPTPAIAVEMINQLTMKKNDIPLSENIRREYVHVLLQTYRNFVKERSD